MNSRAFSHFGGILLCLLWICVCAVRAQSGKDLCEIGRANSDQCAGLKQVCTAAQTDKKCRKDCEDATVSMNVMSNRNLNTGYEKLDANQLPAALRYAKNVCDYDSSLSAKKQELLKKIEEAERPDVSQAKIVEAENDFSNGEFELAGAAAKLVTNKDLQPRANAILQKIQSYKSAMQDGSQKDNGDAAGAIASYKVALSISVKGPGNPAEKIRTLEAQIQLAKTKEDEKTKQDERARQEEKARQDAKLKEDQKARQAAEVLNKGGSKGSVIVPGPDLLGEVAKLLARAKQEEPRNLRDALKTCQQAQHLLPADADASACVGRLQALINSDPTEQAKVLAGALRAFYGSNYTDAEDGFTSYLSSPTAKYRGAAAFYFGASRLYREVLENAGKNPQEAIRSTPVQNHFKEARAACYRPVGKYLAPIVLSAWNASAVNMACTR